MTRGIFTPFTLVVAVLVCGSAIAGAWLLAPSSKSHVPIDPAVSSARLMARIDAYTAARKSDDVTALYALVDPVERRGVDFATFVGTYGHGVLRVESLETRSVTVDDAGRAGRVAMELEARLIPAKLPEVFRRAFQMPADPDSLVERSTLDVDWVLRDRDWYFRLDPQVEAARQAEKFPKPAIGR